MGLRRGWRAGRHRLAGVMTRRVSSDGLMLTACKPGARPQCPVIRSPLTEKTIEIKVLRQMDDEREGKRERERAAAYLA